MDLRCWRHISRPARSRACASCWRFRHKTASKAVDARTAVVLALSPGNAHDAPQDRLQLEDLGPCQKGLPILMDRLIKATKQGSWFLTLGLLFSELSGVMFQNYLA